MHTAALLAGGFLVLWCGVALKIGFRIRANTHRELRYQGIQERLPMGPTVAAILAGHMLGVLIGLSLMLWGWEG